MSKIFTLFYRWKHHAAHSGYDQLLRHLESEIHIITGESFLSSTLNSPFAYYLLRGSRLLPIGYLFDSISGESLLNNDLRRFPESCGYFLYADNQFYLSKFFKKPPGSRYVGTFHLPFRAYHELRLRRTDWMLFDSIVTVSSEEQEYLQNEIGHPSVHFVPHGIDVDFYKPGEQLKSGSDHLRLLFVGSHRRDIGALEKVLVACQSLRLGVHFTVVSRENLRSKFSRYSNLTFRSGLDEVELLRLYREADALFMPVKEGTANNAILEALACGLPILTTDIRGTRDYVHEGCASFFVNDSVDSMVNSIQRIMDDELRSTMALMAREQALKFSWKKVGPAVGQLLRARE